VLIIAHILHTSIRTQVLGLLLTVQLLKCLGTGHCYSRSFLPRVCVCTRGSWTLPAALQDANPCASAIKVAVIRYLCIAPRGAFYICALLCTPSITTLPFQLLPTSCFALYNPPPLILSRFSCAYLPIIIPCGVASKLLVRRMRIGTIHWCLIEQATTVTSS